MAPKQPPKNARGRGATAASTSPVKEVKDSPLGTGAQADSNPKVALNRGKQMVPSIFKPQTVRSKKSLTDREELKRKESSAVTTNGAYDAATAAPSPGTTSLSIVATGEKSEEVSGRLAAIPSNMDSAGIDTIVPIQRN